MIDEMTSSERARRTATASAPGTLAEDLATRSDDALVALLAARPDLASPPPAGTSVLAQRALAAPSINLVADDLDLLGVAVLEQIIRLCSAAAGRRGDEAPGVGTTSADEVRTALSGRADDADITARIDTLRDRALVWGPDDALRTAAHAPAALPGRGLHLTGPLAELDTDALRARIDGLDERERELLDTLAQGSPLGRTRDAARPRTPRGRSPGCSPSTCSPASTTRPSSSHPSSGPSSGANAPGSTRSPRTFPGGRRQSCRRGSSAIRGEGRRRGRGRGGTRTAPPPRRDARRPGGGTGGGVAVGWAGSPRTPARRQGDRPRRDPARVRRRGRRRSATAGQRIPRPPDRRRRGGVGTHRRGRHLDTPTAAEKRWQTVLEAWWTMPRRAWLIGEPSTEGSPTPALAGDLHDVAAPLERRMVIAALAGAEPGTSVDVDSLMELLAWRHPRWQRRLHRRSVEATLDEARMVGVVARGALSSVGGLCSTSPSTVTRGRPPRVRRRQDAAPGDGRRPPRTDRLLSHPGRPDDHRPRSVDTRARDRAVHARRPRIRRRSIGVSRHRGLGAPRPRHRSDRHRDHGFVAAHSRTPVPQSLEYLVADVARRHGQLRVGVATSFVRCEDATTLAAVLAAPVPSRWHCVPSHRPSPCRRRRSVRCSTSCGAPASPGR